MRRYIDLIKHTFHFDTPDFVVKENELYYHGVHLTPLLEKYGTPLRFTYLPKIGENIERARDHFNRAIRKNGYDGKYVYCYCTKSSHFSFVVEEALRNNVQLETSSYFDVLIIKKLYEKGLITKQHHIVCNGFKNEKYKEGIAELINAGFENCIPVLDNVEEIALYKEKIQKPFQVGIRVASDEEPDFEVYTSRLGIRYSDIIDFYQREIAEDSRISLSMLHFFVDSGIKDTVYFWTEFNSFIYKYVELRKLTDTLNILDIGGGFPIKNSLGFEYDYEYMANEIVYTIKMVCKKHGVPNPDLFTEFGSFTVGEAGGMVFSVAGQKQQNDKELWYILDGSLITHLPDTWGTNHKFIMLAVNNWDHMYTQVNLGGMTCDSQDYYTSENHIAKLMLPHIEKGEKQYIGFFNMGAYQESLGGYGGIQHCLIPGAQHVILRRDEDGALVDELFRKEQEPEEMLKTLGYIEEAEFVK